MLKKYIKMRSQHELRIDAISTNIANTYIDGRIKIQWLKYKIINKNYW